MKTYRGDTDGDAATGGPNGPVVVRVDGHETDRLRHLIVHSPGGMAWRYGGSGAADQVLPHDRYDHGIVTWIQDTVAWVLHQDFTAIGAQHPKNGKRSHTWLCRPIRRQMRGDTQSDRIDDG